MSQKPHVQISSNFLHVLSATVARSSPDGNAIRYVFPVLWMTSCFQSGVNGPESKTTRMFRPVRHWRHWGEVCLSLRLRRVS